MNEPKADDSVSLSSILETADGDALDIDAEASAETDADQTERHEDEGADSQHGEDVAEDHLTQTRRGFGKLMVAGAAGAMGIAGTESAAASGTGDSLQSGNWREGYHQYAREYVPQFYKSVATKKNVYRCVKYVAETTNYWETLGKKMDLNKAVVTSAYVYPLPNYQRVDKKSWDGILSSMYAEMPSKYKDAEYKRKWPITVPVVVVYLYDGYYNAVAYLRPYGKSYKSYGYAIKSGYYQNSAYKSMRDYESNTWWWTEDGWGDAGDTDGGILDGVPTGLVD